MYETLKKIAVKIIPNSFLSKNEKFLRGVISLKYRGNKYHCTICEFDMSQFIVLENKDLLCPRCGCLGRARRLWSLIENDLNGNRILHFSPPRPLRERVNKIKELEYITTDYEGEFEADLQLDITKISEPKNSYDRIICYHVLEHIETDLQAMRELYRVLRPGGKIYIQTPFKSGEIYEDLTIKSPVDRLKHYGQDDHVRIYSVDALKDRLESVGFQIKCLTFAENSNNRCGYKVEETVLIVSK